MAQSAGRDKHQNPTVKENNDGEGTIAESQWEHSRLPENVFKAQPFRETIALPNNAAELPKGLYTPSSSMP